MNQERRKLISAQISALQDVEYALTDVAETEQEAFDNMPEGLQNSARGEAMQEALNQLEEAMECIRSACDALSEAMVGE
jgi:hypothetical protein